MFNPFKKTPEDHKCPDMTIYNYELLARLFGLDEAKKSLLNVLPPAPVTPEMVLGDSAALEHMMAGKGWGVLEKAIWFKLLTALRLSLASPTIEEREAARNRVVAHLEILHLPYNMRFSADNIRKMKELEKSMQDSGELLAK